MGLFGFGHGSACECEGSTSIEMLKAVAGAAGSHGSHGYQSAWCMLRKKEAVPSDGCGGWLCALAVLIVQCCEPHMAALAL